MQKGAAGGGGGGGGGGFTDVSFDDLFTKKPEFITDASGEFDVAEQRIELQWNLPSQTRSSFYPYNRTRNN